MDVLSAKLATASPRFRATLASLENFGTPPQPDGIIFPQLYYFFLHPWTPIVFAIVYFFTTKYLSANSDGKNRITGKRWKVVVVMHNLFLAVYSAWTFVSAAPLIFSAFARSYVADGLTGLTHTFCDSSLAFWSNNTFSRVAYLFYLSKFYEVVDTAIILAKGKRVGMLQSYHHAGAVISMGYAFRSMSMPAWIFVVFNSAIHSIMYLYYVASACHLPFPIFLKKNLTRLQITQFLVGGSLAVSYLFIALPNTRPAHLQEALAPLFCDMTHALGSSTLNVTSLEFAAREQLVEARVGGSCLVTPNQRLAVWINVLYLIPLTYLFLSFFINSYRKSAIGQGQLKSSPTETKSVKAE
ncbi:hypothetical protein MVLG_02602 [Microbotryum lychnidis-dioicae p1A1 Lamole]|uniref:Elongation of fatty acids protein n=1 Tax=Microbotryum lychnidis-dioicae (strain p1A1 Lamole / MvSl-1064) TaxID=683840 RepID=U5H5N4_USTV1|nr:hypothetical protein MVLG_02602 [Microbotryum lychnidis-dioicae p1A1 Lamole]|eukprot:KDE07202.1 hypothetical protein MVLG_02602 [Microbotryum lychnidis-dioicae p1A1 Lamole]